jgi:hypothetical protein
MIAAGLAAEKVLTGKTAFVVFIRFIGLHDAVLRIKAGHSFGILQQRRTTIWLSAR